MSTPANAPLIIAAVGDVHGHHHDMVELVEGAADEVGVRPDIVLQVGDFEPHRHEDDAATMAAPSRYRRVGCFPDFHQGRARFPWPVVFIGGNHEPHGFLEHHSDGAELFPGCHYLGRAGVLEHQGLRIAGLSGIWREDTWLEGRPSVAVLERTKKKRYVGFTPADIDRLLDSCGEEPPHVLLLHEWPRLVLGKDEGAQLWAFLDRLGEGAPKGDDELPDLRRIDTVVGSAAALELAQLLEPQLVLCGHVHAPLRTAIRDGGTTIPVRALAKVSMGADAVALFHWTAREGFEELR
jgi:lariat debranching enzyme